MSTKQIEEFFYSRASARIKERVENSALSHSRIYKPDHKQISRIINNKRTPNNPFLICDAVIENYYQDDETGTSIACGLLHTPELKFHSIKEILWGTEKEISSYLPELFILLWEEVSASPKYQIDTESYLCDFVPYAKDSGYWDVFLSPTNIYPALFYGIREDTIIGDIDLARENAIIFLYNKCKDDFKTLFEKFTEEQKSFHMFKNIVKKDLLENLFIKMLKKYEPDSSSLGLRVRDLIKSDLSHCAEQVVSTEKDPFYTALIHASQAYILALEKIQKLRTNEEEVTK